MAITGVATTLLIALGLAMDAFTVSIGASSSGRMHLTRSKLRLAGHFGLFQLGMTLVGWQAGGMIAGWIESLDHWIALGLLSYVGLLMVRSGLSQDDRRLKVDPDQYRSAYPALTPVIQGQFDPKARREGEKRV
jgi:manganese efflux pump family protein